MKHLSEYRDADRARTIAAAIAREALPERRYRIMEFCGGHTHAIFRYGLQDLLPANVEMVHGPGCPVCVLPVGRLDMAMRIAEQPGVILATYGDMLRVPGVKGRSLLKAKADGADIRMVYSAADAVAIAAQNPDREVVFLAIGFETTTPPTALALREAKARGLTNFSAFVNHVLTPAALAAILGNKSEAELVEIDGILGPSHVSVVTGYEPYEFATKAYGRPVVIAGFEPVDVLQSILMVVRQLNEGRCEVENQYIRAVGPGGNALAQALTQSMFEERNAFEWRGLGWIPHSALKLRPEWSAFDAEVKFGVAYRSLPETKSCECPAILRGQKKPMDCKLFGKACTPETPLGACMVLAEGSCAAYYTYGRFREEAA
ncbi:MAG: hydrogenase formation protein HypD [Labrys sp. (in: a-proteobacteria)]|jgi:hydrogenase expression/formation protein HypD